MAPQIDPADQRHDGDGGPEFWLGLDELTATEDFKAMMAREFPEDATEWADPVTRRQFITLMGASLALAGVAGCESPMTPRPGTRHVLTPPTVASDQYTPGIPFFLATTYTLDGVSTGVLVKSTEGRPIKVEGNEKHPGSLGGTDVLAQASVLGMYDPDRSQAVTLRGEPKTWDSAVAEFRKILATLRTRGGAGLRLLTETVGSPTLAAQINELLKAYPDAKWVQYEPTGRDAVREGGRRAFGKYVNTVYDFTKADVVLSLDADFIGCTPGNPRYNRDFAGRRKVRKNAADGNGPDKMNRLYAVESMCSNTGASADHRLPIRARDIEGFARALAAKLGVAGAPAAGTLSDLAKAWIDPLAEDLNAHKGSCVVIAGEGQPASLHALVHAINAALGNVGKTVYSTAPVEAKPTNQLAEFKALVEEMKTGKVDTLLILGGNPVYTSPADFDFAAALAKVPHKIHLGLYQDETAVLCDWHVNEAYYLEAWGDGRAYDGTVSIQQPLIAPLYDGKSALELLASFTDRPELLGRDIVQEYWKAALKDQASGDWDLFWQKALQDGVVPNTAFKLETPALGADWAKPGPGDASPGAGGYEVVFRADPTVYDGRFANNGWLQELPKPVTKLTWDNAVIMSPRTADKLGIPYPWPRWTAGERGRAETYFVELAYKGRKVKGAVWVQPGHADESITLHLGYGRTRAGRVGNAEDGKGGFNVYALRTSDAPGFDAGLEIAKTSETTFLACTQMHHSMEGRKPVRRATVKQYKTPEEFNELMLPPVAAAEASLIKENVPGPGERTESKHDDHGHDHDEGHEHKHDPRLVPLTLYPDYNKEGRRWAMTIDLTACTGCSACAMACVAENNIPVVGKKEVTRAREMHWIRIDRYFTLRTEEQDREHKSDDDKRMEMAKDPAAVETFFQPVPCQQCEKAPCELVCPVAATVHSADGLNDMVYNRCVGTRYCSNNCPYKVRRFNFLTYADFHTPSWQLGRNPEVTVRSRGVMEKCTYCVQRIRFAEIEAERERRPIHDGEVVTACQAACPSAAISFGDMADPKSVVRRWKTEPTNYGLLAELNTMPRTTYLAAIRNPNPKMPAPAKGA
jgi:molybdopterin-containing oxidoreductase family iron-sulfur binding subunit